MNNLKKAFRGPVLWILIALVLIIGAMNFASQATGFKEVPTSEVVAIINGTDKLNKVELIDGEQTIRVTKDDGKTKIKAQWVDNQSEQLVTKLNERVANKSLDEWVGSNPGPSIWTSLLYNFLPFLLLIVGFFFVMSMLQGGGGGRGR